MPYLQLLRFYHRQDPCPVEEHTRGGAIIRGHEVGPPVNELDDDQVAAAVARGEPDALRELYRRYAASVAAMAVLMTADPDKRTAILDDTFLTVWKRAVDFDQSRTRLRTWLLTLAHRRAVLHLRASGERLEANALSDAESALAFLPEQLPERERRLLAAAFFGGRTVLELLENFPGPPERLGALLLRSLVRLYRTNGETVASQLLVAARASGGAEPAGGLVHGAEALVDYALGTIEPARAYRFEAALVERPELATGLRHMQDALAELIAGLPQLPLGGQDEERIVTLAAKSAPARLPERHGRAGSGPLWAALMLAATLGLTAWLLFQRLSNNDSGPPPPTFEQESAVGSEEGGTPPGAGETQSPPPQSPDQQPAGGPRER